jgi:hypothetical protein
MKFNYKITIAFFSNGTSGFVCSKERREYGSEVVNVVKPYTAAISDAFKVPETPV